MEEDWELIACEPEVSTLTRRDHHTLSLHPVTAFLLDPSRLVNADPASPVISDRLYSGFLEHLGRCIYGGLVDDPDHPSPRRLLDPQPRGRLGWRTDVMALLRNELEIPVLRWPGGTWLSSPPADCKAILYPTIIGKTV